MMQQSDAALHLVDKAGVLWRSWFWGAVGRHNQLILVVRVDGRIELEALQLYAGDPLWLPIVRSDCSP